MVPLLRHRSDSRSSLSSGLWPHAPLCIWGFEERKKRQKLSTLHLRARRKGLLVYILTLLVSTLRIAHLAEPERPELDDRLLFPSNMELESATCMLFCEG